MQVNMHVDIGERLLDIDGPLDIAHHMLYNREELEYSPGDSFFSETHDSSAEAMQDHVLCSLPASPGCEAGMHDDEVAKYSNQETPYAGSDGASSRKSCKNEDGVDAVMKRNELKAESEFVEMVECRGGAGGAGEDIARTGENSGARRAKHVCHECGKTFKRAHNLKIHGRLHSGDKPYGCPFPNCAKEFRWKSSIVSHINWHRTKRGDVLPGDVSVNVHRLIVKKSGKKGGAGRDAAAEGGARADGGAGGGEAGCTRQTGGASEGAAARADVAAREDGADGADMMSDMRELCELEAGLGEVGLQYENGLLTDVSRSSDDATAATRSTAGSYAASAEGGAADELEGLGVFGEGRGWETRSEGRGSGLSGMLLPSLSCCRLESDADGLAVFLGDGN